MLEGRPSHGLDPALGPVSPTKPMHPSCPVQVAPILEGGPARGLDPFLESLQLLERSNTTLQRHKGLAAVQAALKHSQSVFDAALQVCLTTRGWQVGRCE